MFMAQKLFGEFIFDKVANILYHCKDCQGILEERD